MLATTEVSQQCRVLVVGMRGDHHHASQVVQPLQRLPDFDLARDRPLRSDRAKKNAGEGDSEKQETEGTGDCR